MRITIEVDPDEVLLELDDKALIEECRRRGFSVVDARQQAKAYQKWQRGESNPWLWDPAGTKRSADT